MCVLPIKEAGFLEDDHVIAAPHMPVKVDFPKDHPQIVESDFFHLIDVVFDFFISPSFLNYIFNFMFAPLVVYVGTNHKEACRF